MIEVTELDRAVASALDQIKAMVGGAAILLVIAPDDDRQPTVITNADDGALVFIPLIMSTTVNTAAMIKTDGVSRQ